VKTCLSAFTIHYSLFVIHCFSRAIVRKSCEFSTGLEGESMPPKKAFITLISCCFLLVALQHSASGQTPLDNCTDVQNSKDYYFLGTRIGELNSDIRQLEEDLNELQARLPDAMSEQELRDVRQKIDDLQRKPNKSVDEESTLRLLKAQIQGVVSEETLKAQLDEKKKELEAKRNLVRCIQYRLSTIFSPEQSFKLWMSIAFAFLIGMVIAGFFWLSYKDGSMRRAIFAGQTGIQFLTLFSIVIAIILFGITGILQDKELAALLGGISGYILGRTGRKDESSAAPSFLEKLDSISIPATAALSTAAPTAQLKATPKDKNGKAMTDNDGEFKPKWTSSNPAIATVDQKGLVTRVAVGSCNVTASFKDMTSNTCVVTCT
jgi:uncharacterized protein YjdB